ncbi:MAG TPA: PHB depolymerase family esterase [Steroidobacteraceae bacterium]|nr:PHB depolymerase family esterase [Steroidobacteraceae bacterium]
MRRLLRWFKSKIAVKLPALPALARPLARSRFLSARFKDPTAETLFKLDPRPELGYRLYVPGGSSRRHSLPLIVMLHGCRQDSLTFAEGTRMNTLAEAARCAVLYPEQSTQANPLRCWNWFDQASIAGRGEAAFIAHLIDKVVKRRRIDPQRVYLAGMSAGGAMACLLAIRHSRLFAACAIHSGIMYGAAASPMQALSVMRSGAAPTSVTAARKLVREAGASGIAVPTLVIHGDRDTTVNPVNADQIIEQMKECIEFADPAAGAVLAGSHVHIATEGHAYRQQDYTQQGRLMLRKILVDGLGHAWSGGDSRLEFNDAQAPDAGQLILDFVMSHRREVHTIAAASVG